MMFVARFIELYTVLLPRRLHTQLKLDAQFLKRLGVMDYSLLLGIHFCSRDRERGGVVARGPGGRPELGLEQERCV